MNLVLWIIFGAIVGWLAAIFRGTNGTVPGHKSVLIGIAAAVIGGIVTNLIWHESINHFNIYSLLSAVFLSMLVIWVWEGGDHRS